MNDVIRVSPKHFEEIKHLAKDSFIAAIKKLREVGKEYPSVGGNRQPPSLTSSKKAIEKLLGRRDAGVDIICSIEIESMTLNLPNGEKCTLDFDELQLKVLDGLTTLPIEALEASLELMQMMRDWKNKYDF
jgi:hypothetical protein